jgi:hypothetical protein
MTKIVVLFNLKADAKALDYENWARTTDLPTVNALGSIDSFSLLKSSSMLGTDQAPPYAYIEILDINDFEAFGGDVKTEIMEKVASEFQAFADAPMFIVTEDIK